LLSLRSPSGSLCSGDSGAAGAAHGAAFLGTHLSRCGYRSCGGRGLRPAWTTLAELRFDSGYLHGNRFKLASIADEGHLEDGVV